MNTSRAQDRVDAEGGNNARRAILRVGGLHCEGCARTLRYALSSVAGVTEADVDFKNQRAIVVFDPAQADEAKLRKTIKDVGYRVR